MKLERFCFHSKQNRSSGAGSSDASEVYASPRGLATDGRDDVRNSPAGNRVTDQPSPNFLNAWLIQELLFSLGSSPRDCTSA